MANPRNRNQDTEIEGGKHGRGGIGGKAEDVANEEEGVVEQSANVGGSVDDDDEDLEGFDEVAEEADDEADGDIGAAEDEDRSRR